jgi:hypothetical protein
VKGPSSGEPPKPSTKSYYEVPMVTAMVITAGFWLSHSADRGSVPGYRGWPGKAPIGDRNQYSVASTASAASSPSSGVRCAATPNTRPVISTLPR